MASWRTLKCDMYLGSFIMSFRISLKFEFVGFTINVDRPKRALNPTISKYLHIISLEY